MHRIFIFFGIWMLVDLYSFQAYKTVVQKITSPYNSYLLWSFWIIDLLMVAILFGYGFSGKLANGPTKSVNWIFGLTMISLVPKLITIPFLLVEDLSRMLTFLVRWISHFFSAETSGIHYPDRRAFVSKVALGLASLPLAGMIYGVWKGKYNYRIHRVTFKFKDLPDAFDGFTITQLSDIHAGSFDNREAVAGGVALVNKQKSDLFVFTGDLVNNKAEEMDEWKSVFSEIQAEFGQYSILGNHDYGDYIPWESEKAKEANLDQVKQTHAEIGFRLLLNEHVTIEKDGQQLVLAGVENWGKKGFVKHGDLDKALHSVTPTAFCILLSHDPSHWEAKVLDHPKKVHLTLSGHTHGMQFGIEIPGFRWSPSKYIYPQWAGAYGKEERFLYVNRGFGFLGFPGRVGIHPEITVIRLEKA